MTEELSPCVFHDASLPSLMFIGGSLAVPESVGMLWPRYEEDTMTRIRVKKATSISCGGRKPFLAKVVLISFWAKLDKRIRAELQF